MVITIDGPAGSGKSTVARKLANRLGLIHLNSGALFRAVGRSAVKNGVALDDESGVVVVAERLRFNFELDSAANTRFLVDDEVISEQLGSEEVGKLASKVAQLPLVRQVLLNFQRGLAERCSLVVEGRDSGTVVFPDADFKFYLDASLEVRAERRMREMLGGKPNLAESLLDKSQSSQTVEYVREQIAQRDHADSTRKVAPQRVPEGAVVIDTSVCSPDEVVERIVHGLS